MIKPGCWEEKNMATKMVAEADLPIKVKNWATEIYCGYDEN